MFTYEGSDLKVFCQEDIVKNFQKFTEKYLSRASFLVKL